MAHASFVLNAVPVQITATSISVDATFYTTRGNSMRFTRQYTVAAYTVANLYAALQAVCNAIETAETNAVNNPPAPDPAAAYVGIRYDVTKGTPTAILPIDMPQDTGKPPVAGG
jgi:hypothetical protein